MSRSIVEGKGDGRTGGTDGSCVGLCTNNSVADQFKTNRSFAKYIKKIKIDAS